MRGLRQVAILSASPPALCWPSRHPFRPGYNARLSIDPLARPTDAARLHRRRLNLIQPYLTETETMAHNNNNAEPLRTLDDLADDAYNRGHDDGEGDAILAAAEHDTPHDAWTEIDVLRETVSPLSGEWAGRSVPELLGDLLDYAADVLGLDAERDSYSAEIITDAYERGYFEGIEKVACGMRQANRRGAA